jgi:TonB family protein
MRVERALGKLHDRLVRRGVTSSSAALAAALAAQSVIAAPAGVAGAASAAALTVGSGAAGIWLTLMATSKLPVALTAAALVAGSLVIGVQEKALGADTRALATLMNEDAVLPVLVRQNRQLAVSALHARSLLDDASAVPALERQLADLEAASRGASGRPSGAPAGDALVSSTNDRTAFDVSNLDVQPKIIKQGRPAPAPDLYAAGASGEVLVDFTIGTDGAVHNATVVSSSNRAFEASAIDAVSQWVFSPGQLGGHAVAVHMRVPIVYSLSSEPPPPAAATLF